jgi:hypothetical protein
LPAFASPHSVAHAHHSTAQHSTAQHSTCCCCCCCSWHLHIRWCMTAVMSAPVPSETRSHSLEPVAHTLRRSDHRIPPPPRVRAGDREGALRACACACVCVRVCACAGAHSQRTVRPHCDHCSRSNSMQLKAAVHIPARYGRGGGMPPACLYHRLIPHLHRLLRPPHTPVAGVEEITADCR